MPHTNKDTRAVGDPGDPREGQSPHSVDEFFALCCKVEAKVANDCAAKAIIHAESFGNRTAADHFRIAQDAILDGLALLDEVSK